jgi:hypothetical protein
LSDKEGQLNVIIRFSFGFLRFTTGSISRGGGGNTKLSLSSSINDGDEAPESQHIPAAPPPPMNSSTEEDSVDSTPKGQLFDSNSLSASKY